MPKCKSHETCYCCENIAVGQGDHVPFKKLFPKGAFSDIKPIIVPSCNIHNQDMSEHDEYLKFVFSSTSKSAPEEIVFSTVRGIDRLLRKKSNLKKKYGLEINDREIRTDGTALVDFDLLNPALEKIARGLYYHHHDGTKKLLGELFVFPIFLGIDPLAGKDLLVLEQDILQDMQEIGLIGALQEIFAYQVVESDEMICINMRFYSDKIVSVMHTQRS